ncbi:MAG: carbamoyl-phosphate synthase (glutamine-hydrolyzing) large subunit [Pseudomonadota bacterium]
MSNKNNSLKTVLILGSGGLSIGQAGEFDYSGSQAIKACKEEGIKTVLVNPNIATIQTSKDLADEVYFVPVEASFVEKVIVKEKPDGIMLSFGGQAALNCGIDLYKKDILRKHNVKVLGTEINQIIESEDKGIFAKRLESIDIKTPKSHTVSSLTEGLLKAKEIGFPLIIRSGFSLGGLGSSFCESENELREELSKALAHSNQVLIEESLKGFKEIEYEIMRDGVDNCIAICNMENFDPLGIHTGESIVVAPSQTLTDYEYQKLRNISLKIARHFEILGECNVQFALDPNSDDYRVIEINARLSRSSALASKATGYPIAFIAAKLGLGYSLLEINNPITKVTKSFFEPSMDYLALKFPRWDTAKFSKAAREIGSSMKSVGEVMAIGRNFEEALQKAIRMTNPSFSGLTEDLEFEELDKELINPTDRRIFAISKALAHGYSVDKIHELTKIDLWFIHKLNNIILEAESLKQKKFESLDKISLLKAKKLGFSDKQIARLIFNKDDIDAELAIREIRKTFNINPSVKQIDTLAAEYPSETNYLYLTYNGDVDDTKAMDNSVIVLGSGPYSIGSSVEFDWCSVECVKTLKEENIKSIVINCNPETVSTDYDECDKLYFEELSFERVLDIYEKENPKGIIINMGGQIPNNLAIPLRKVNANILGTTPEVIDQVENRHKFSALLDELKIDQPEWIESINLAEVNDFCNKVSYPVLVRPSYVLSGSAMNVAYDEESLGSIIKNAEAVSNDYPVVVTKFITEAKEIDMDIVASKGEIKAYAISEHIENAGVHSGDATLVTPAQKLYLETMNRIKKISRSVIKHLNITGPVNFQFLAKDNHIKIIECNLRCSRSFPFVSKTYDINFINLATKAILGQDIEKVSSNAFDLEYLACKAPQFSFTRLHGADPQLGVEMASTGEVACFGEDLHEAFLKAILATGFKLPKKNILISTGNIKQKAKLLDSVQKLITMGFSLYATPKTSEFYNLHGIETEVLYWPMSEQKPNVLDYLNARHIDLVINIPSTNKKDELTNGYMVRRKASDFGIPLITNVQVAVLFVDALYNYSDLKLKVKSYKEYLSS